MSNQTNFLHIKEDYVKKEEYSALEKQLSAIHEEKIGLEQRTQEDQEILRNYRSFGDPEELRKTLDNLSSEKEGLLEELSVEKSAIDALIDEND